MEHSLAIAETISKKSPVAVQTSKKSIIYSRDHSVDEGLEHIVRYLGFDFSVHNYYKSGRNHLFPHTSIRNHLIFILKVYIHFLDYLFIVNFILLSILGILLLLFLILRTFC